MQILTDYKTTRQFNCKVLLKCFLLNITLRDRPKNPRKKRRRVQKMRTASPPPPPPLWGHGMRLRVGTSFTPRAVLEVVVGGWSRGECLPAARPPRYFCIKYPNLSIRALAPQTHCPFGCCGGPLPRLGGRCSRLIGCKVPLGYFLTFFTVVKFARGRVRTQVAARWTDQ